MEIFAQKLTNLLVLSGKIEMNEEDIIKYGIEILISSFLIFISMIVLSIFIFDRYDGIVFTLFFVTIRLLCGGFHASTYYKCYALSLSVFCFSVVEADKFPINSVFIKILIMTLCYFYIYISTPQININHPISAKVAKLCKTRVKRVIIGNMLFFTLLSLQENHYSSVAMYTTVSIVILILLSNKGHIQGGKCDERINFSN